MKKFTDLVGHTIASIDRNDSDFIEFKLSDGTICRLYHEQDCCEGVSIDETQGNLSNLIGSPLIMATEEIFAQVDPPGYVPKENSYRDSWTWTIYTLATEKCVVTIRWLGESNGYYSEDVNFLAIKATP